MLNKLIVYFIIVFFGISIALNAQTTPDKKTPKFTEKDIRIDNDSVSKPAFEQNFKRKYSDEDFSYEPKIEKPNAWERFLESVSRFFSELFNLTNNKATNVVIEIVLKVLAICLIIFVVYLIVKSILNKEGQWIFGKNSDRKIINYEDVEKNLKLIDFQKLIAQTIKNGENRLAVRYYYLWLLKRLSEKEIIFWDVEKTNSDYVYEISNPEMKQNFSYLSYLYNYIWYGEFDLDQETFEKAQQAFENSIKKL
jgi:preprotein translocase subunit SecG